MCLPLYITWWNLVLLYFQFDDHNGNRTGGLGSIAYEYQIFRWLGILEFVGMYLTLHLMHE